MDLKEISDNLIENLMCRMLTDRKTATEAVLLSVAWLSSRGMLRHNVPQQADSADEAIDEHCVCRSYHERTGDHVEGCPCR